MHFMITAPIISNEAGTMNGGCVRFVSVEQEFQELMGRGSVG